MNNIKIDTNEINKIIKKTIGAIDSSREEILKITDHIRNDYENLKLEIASLKILISNIISEVDELEMQDKIMRQKLVDVSKNFTVYTEEQVKEVYNSASNIRIKFMTKANEEKALKERRNRLELELKKSLDNIQNAEKIINQISIAMGYLDGEILSMLDDADKNSEMFTGIKILEAQESERKRIARDIHDGPAQHMANVIIKIDLCKKLLESNFDRGLNELASLKENVKEALKEVRSILFDLKPISLDGLGLINTIEQTVNKLSVETGIDIKLKLKPINQEIQFIIQLAVYRIFQEILNNIKKHSKAKHVIVKLDFGSKYLILIISDDGIGFDVNETLNNVKVNGNSYGLIGISDRVSQLQGNFQITSSKGAGTVFQIKLPINREVVIDDKRNN